MAAAAWKIRLATKNATLFIIMPRIHIKIECDYIFRTRIPSSEMQSYLSTAQPGRDLILASFDVLVSEYILAISKNDVITVECGYITNTMKTKCKFVNTSCLIT